MNTKNKLIENYLKLVQDQGIGAISVRNLTSAVGITKSSFYNHFESIYEIEDAVINFCLEEINKASFEINYKANDAEDLFIELINSYIDTFSQYPASAFLCMIESQKLTNDKFFQLSQRVDLMISSRLTVALDFCVQRGWSSIGDTDSLAKILTPYVKTLLVNQNLTDDDLSDSVRAILTLLR